MCVCGIYIYTYVYAHDIYIYAHIYVYTCICMITMYTVSFFGLNLRAGNCFGTTRPFPSRTSNEQSEFG